MNKPVSGYLTLFFWLISGTMGLLNAQAPKVFTSSDQEQALRKLKMCGTVLYIAAHPDDENTRLIAWLAQERKLDVYYLSLTRGDGGQNLIGPELGEGLGVIRTNELLAARNIDGGKQLFSRARDFGFSKNAEETFTIWPRREVLRDVVRIVRHLKPDVIITRFSPEPGPTHGHHTASAQLALEAFKVAAGNDFADDMQADGSKPWQTKRIFWNISSFFFQGREKEFNPDKYLKLDVGTFNPIRGKNYAEIAADSRSQHKSQGFGSAGSRGASPEYFQQLAGDSAKTDILEGLDFSWKKYANGKKIEAAIDSAIRNFDPANPSGIAHTLLRIRNLIEPSEQKAEPSQKNLLNRRKQLAEELLFASVGLRLEATSERQVVSPGQAFNLNAEITLRSHFPVKLTHFSGLGKDSAIQDILGNNQPVKLSLKGAKVQLPFSNPFWLREAGEKGLFKVHFPGEYANFLPDNIAPSVQATLQVFNTDIKVNIPVRYKYTDPVKGELYQPLEVLPEITLETSPKVLLLGAGKRVPLKVKLQAQTATVGGKIKLEVSEDVEYSPKEIDYPALKEGQEFEAEFTVEAFAKAKGHSVTAVATNAAGTIFRNALQRIRYDHIPNQVLLPRSETRAVPINLSLKGQKIAYIHGAGDEVPACLRSMGYTVDILTQPDVTLKNLKNYDALVMGIRAYNTQNWLKTKKTEMDAYLNQGGNIIVQYNTSNFLSAGAGLMDSVAPYPLKLSNSRVTVEGSPVKMLDDKHPVLNTPNKISPADFEDWVQERGLYYPKTWDKAYTPILGMNDPGEAELQGSLLIAQVGKGHYIYTGISFFRQLPAGVPGAYRLMANLIGLGKK